MIADIDNLLLQHNPAFQLTYGLTDESKDKLVNPLRYSVRTWMQEKTYQFAIFSKAEHSAIVNYLEIVKDRDEFERNNIEQALRNYWH